MDEPSLRKTQWYSLAIVIFAGDQAAKSYIDATTPLGWSHEVASFFNLVHALNPGAAFSFLASEEGWQRWLFTGLGVVAAGVILVILRRTRGQPHFCLALAMILGGAIGNVIDRVVYGHVVDFLLFYWRDWYYPAFNVADVGITCGAVLLVLDELLRARKPRV